jgi:hypothetical protein
VFGVKFTDKIITAINEDKYALKGIFQQRDSKEDYCFWYFPKLKQNALTSKTFIEFLCYNLNVNEKNIKGIYKAINKQDLKMPYIIFNNQTNEENQISLKIFLFYLDKFNNCADSNITLDEFISDYDVKIGRAILKLENDKKIVDSSTQIIGIEKPVSHEKSSNNTGETEVTLDLLEDFNVNDYTSTEQVTHNFT